MNYIEALVVTNAESADLLCELLAPFAEDNSVVQEQLGDPADLNPTAAAPPSLIIYSSASYCGTATFA